MRQKKAKSTIHFNIDSMNTELLFQTIHFVNQLTIYGAVANWCHQFGLTEEEKGRANFSVDDKTLTSLQREEVQLLVSLTTMTPGNRMRENVLSFEALASRIQLTQLCERAFFQYRVTDLMGATDGEQSLLCAGNTHFLDLFRNPKSCEGAIIGPVLEVQFVNPANTSYVAKSRATDCFVNEIHDHKGPVTNCSLLNREPLAARRLVLTILPRKLVRTLPAILLVILFSTNSHSWRTKTDYD